MCSVQCVSLIYTNTDVLLSFFLSFFSRYLISRVGTVATRAMQGFVPKTESSATDGWLATALTTRHLIGYHSSNEMGLAQINVSEHDLYDTYLPAYQSYMAQREAWTGDLGGRAEAIMCSFARFNGVPSCASPRLLKDILREQWKSEALVQTDCCDSINNIYINVRLTYTAPPPTPTHPASCHLLPYP